MLPAADCNSLETGQKTLVANFQIPIEQNTIQKQKPK